MAGVSVRAELYNVSPRAEQFILGQKSLSFILFSAVLKGIQKLSKPMAVQIDEQTNE